MMGVIALKKIFKLFQNVSCSTEIYDADNSPTVIIYPIFNRQGSFHTKSLGEYDRKWKLRDPLNISCINNFHKGSKGGAQIIYSIQDRQG